MPISVTQYQTVGKCEGCITCFGVVTFCTLTAWADITFPPPLKFQIESETYNCSDRDWPYKHVETWFQTNFYEDSWHNLWWPGTVHTTVYNFSWYNMPPFLKYQSLTRQIRVAQVGSRQHCAIADDNARMVSLGIKETLTLSLMGRTSVILQFKGL